MCIEKLSRWPWSMFKTCRDAKKEYDFLLEDHKARMGKQVEEHINEIDGIHEYLDAARQGLVDVIAFETEHANATVRNMTKRANTALEDSHWLDF